MMLFYKILLSTLLAIFPYIPDDGQTKIETRKTINQIDEILTEADAQGITEYESELY